MNPMDYQLRTIRGSKASATIRLVGHTMLIGRHDSCPIRIHSPQVSRQHCELVRREDDWVIRELGSSNGTMINGKRLGEEHVLQNGDVIQVGPVAMKVEPLTDLLSETGITVSENSPETEAAPVASEADAVIANEEDFAVDALTDFEESFELDEVTELEPAPPVGGDDPTTVTSAQENATPSATEPVPLADGDDAVADFLASIDDLDDDDSKTK